MKNKYYYVASALSYEHVELFNKMLPLFEGIELVRIYEDDARDEDGYILCKGFSIEICMGCNYRNIYEVLIKGFDFEEIEL
jgi:hypothetical protein